MRILHVISGIDPKTGGTAAALIGMAVAQAGAGLDVAVASTYTEESGHLDAVRRLRDNNVQVEMIGPCRSRLTSASQIRQRLPDLIAQADIVHVHALWEEIQHRACSVARRLRVPYVITPHGMLAPWSLSQGKWKKRLYLQLRLKGHLNHAAAVHYTTEAERCGSEPLKLAAPSIVETLGVDLAEFAELPAKGGLQNRYPQLQGRRIVLFLSRVHYKKGLDLLIPAFADANIADAALVIAGPAAEGYLPQVEAMVRKHGLEQRTVFTGMLHGAERIAALVDADLFVLPSYQENFGVVVVESLAAGTPVIISDQVNLCDQVLKAGVGAVVPTQVEPLTAAIRLWMTDPILRRQAAERALPFVRATFDWRAVGQRWREHYQAVALKR